MRGALNDASAREVDFEILRHDKEALDIDVTRCRFAEFFRAHGEPEFGAPLICDTDLDIASVGAGEVDLDRADTLMRGGSRCTFRYKFTPRWPATRAMIAGVTPSRAARSCRAYRPYRALHVMCRLRQGRPLFLLQHAPRWSSPA
jgi:hypothetical protein